MHGTPTKPVRPRNAASLVLLRPGNGGPEVLLGQRGATARFMPGRFVFPGGVVQRDDRLPWPGEATSAGSPASRAAARAALRETFEETGFLLGRLAGTATTPARAPHAAAEAYRARGFAPALDALIEIGRAITPTFSPMRFHARFFVADGSAAVGPLHPGEELDSVGWYEVAADFPAPMSHVTRFMLEQAIAAWRTGAVERLPLYRHIKGVARVDWRS
jgi:8-oxo-dGTP pyrophosphatase MutT (NUDIX family)